jgi:hypothetical protein
MVSLRFWIVCNRGVGFLGAGNVYAKPAALFLVSPNSNSENNSIPLAFFERPQISGLHLCHRRASLRQILARGLRFFLGDQ